MSKNIKEIKIKSYNDLIKIIQGKTNLCEDLREKFIFRGMEDDTYEFKPSALRTNNRLNDFVDEDFKLTLSLTHEQAVEYKFAEKEDYYKDREFFTVNKYGELIDTKSKDFVTSWEEFQCVKELHTLIKFLSYADKVGLKVPVKQNVRELLEQNFHNIFNHDTSLWPSEKFYELMALSQHYGVPTRALDWSYDYKTALYFAVKNILNEDYLTNKKPENAILWAFNYKHFNKFYLHQNKTYCVKHYRPEYNTNPNLNAQKGLFTFVIKKVWENSNESFEKHIEEFLEIFNKNEKIMPKDKYAFYKFIIPEEIKPEILNELYLEGYSEEYLFPGYRGVSKTIENRVKLDRLIKNTKTK